MRVLGGARGVAGRKRVLTIAFVPTFYDYENAGIIDWKMIIVLNRFGATLRRGSKGGF